MVSASHPYYRVLCDTIKELPVSVTSSNSSDDQELKSRHEMSEITDRRSPPPQLIDLSFKKSLQVQIQQNYSDFLKKTILIDNVRKVKMNQSNNCNHRFQSNLVVEVSTTICRVNCDDRQIIKYCKIRWTESF
jgi:hypothetical protein